VPEVHTEAHTDALTAEVHKETAEVHHEEAKLAADHHEGTIHKVVSDDHKPEEAKNSEAHE